MTDHVKDFARAAPGVTAATEEKLEPSIHEYRGELRSTDASVRIFTPPPDSDDSVQTAFQKNASEWYNISTHPNVVSVVARGTEPRPWLAVERPRGELLDVRHSSLSVPEIRTIIKTVAETLRIANLYNRYFPIEMGTIKLSR